MNVAKVIIMSMLSAGLVFGIGNIALADGPESGTTQANVTFQAESSTPSLTVPGTFGFGEQTLSSQGQDYTLNAGTNPTVTVTDNRGTGAGWEVTVQANKLHTDSNKKLEGGNLLIEHSQNVNGNGSVAVKPDVAADSVYADGFDLDGNPIPVKIVSAKSDNHQGMGQWDVSWNDSQIHLKVAPGEAYSQTYTTDIVWTLYNTPQPQ